MRGYLAALPLALLMLPAAAAAQAAPPLDPAAITLARLLMTGEETTQDDDVVARIRTRIQNDLLSEPGACNPSTPGCIGEARAAAQQFAPVFMRAELARRERINAYLLADTLTPDEMARFAQYLGGADGQKLLAAMIRLRQPDGNDRRRRELERTIEASAVPGAMAQARALFRQRTRNMPARAPR
jgi:hypothetical protein